jgi:hypothetical protein
MKVRFVADVNFDERIIIKRRQQRLLNSLKAESLLALSQFLRNLHGKVPSMICY